MRVYSSIRLSCTPNL